MEINKKSRTELKAYFVKNALPTESNFRDLIDAGLNQKDDGLVKAADQPVQIAASTAGDKPAIHLYESFATDTKPAWVLSLQAGGKKGLGIGDGDGDGKKCLFIDATTGDVGIGTIDPAGNKLRVAGSVLVDGADGKARVSFGSSNRQMLNLYKEEHGVGVQSSTTYFRSSANFAFYKGGAHSDGALDPGTGGAAMLVIKDGNVGIGTTDPAGYKLKVAGNTRIEGTLEINQEAWKNATLLNTWVPYDLAEFSSAAYFKDTCGIVHLRGLIKGGNINRSPPTGTIFILPAGYRPQYHQICMTSTYEGGAPTNIGGRIDIHPDGQVVAWAGYNAWFCLDGVTFRAV